MTENEETQKPKTYLLKGNELELARAVIRANKKAEGLIAELRQQEHRVAVEHKAEVDAIWSKLSKSLGVDENKSVSLDVQYYEEHGLLFIVEHFNPIEAAMNEVLMSAVSKRMN